MSQGLHATTTKRDCTVKGDLPNIDRYIIRYQRNEMPFD